MRFFLHGFPTVGATRRWAAAAEADGYDGVCLADSETLLADPSVELTLAAGATSRIELGVAVTNPVTRHPAVTASAISTVHAESGGRAFVGFARGDSALRQLGLHPTPVSSFRQAILDLQRYLGAPASDPPVSAASPLAWPAPSLPKVDVDVAATGPEVISVGAVHADRLTFTLGADVERLAWAVDVARTARIAAGLDPDGLSLGAYVDVACAPSDEATAMVRGSAAIFVHLLAEGMRHGVPVADSDRGVIARVAEAFDEAHHGSSTAPQAAVLSDAFLARFALCGPAPSLVPRVRELAGLGLDRLIVVPASHDVDPARVRASAAAFAREVIPRSRTV